MRIALAQINPILGNFKYNSEKIINEIKRAKERKCDLVVFPEASLFGYHPFDLLEREKLVDQQTKFLNKIEKEIPKGIIAIIGLFTKNKKKQGRPYYNSAAIVQKNKKTRFMHKELLPTGDVFDEARFIQSGDLSKNIINLNGKKTLITICEDIWAWPNKNGHSNYLENPILKIRENIDLIINLSASPYYFKKIDERLLNAHKVVKKLRAPLVYVNMVGAQDEIIYDGGSFILDKNGKLINQSAFFEEDLNVFDFNKKIGGFRKQKLTESEKIKHAIVLGIRDFCKKTNFNKIHLGISGGIDSAVVACLAADAIGPQHISLIAMPSQFNSSESLTLSEKLVKNIGCQLIQFPIENIYKIFEKQINEVFKIQSFSTVHENLQARIRGLILMAYSNQNKSLLFSTSNKSEYATGYSTLYGDMCGALAPIGDLTKHQIYELAHLYNKEIEIIPNRIIERPPTAELRFNQKDQDSLPEYNILDKSVENIVEKSQISKNETDGWLLEMLFKTEFKRWQAPPILKVSSHSFGRGRRLPIAHQARE